MYTVTVDMCMHGPKRQGSGGKQERTKFMTNSWCIAKEFEAKRDKNHVHVHLLSGKANAAAEYLEGLCRAVCRGLIEEKKRGAMESGQECKQKARRNGNKCQIQKNTT